jgi:hypothetical protein
MMRIRNARPIVFAAVSLLALAAPAMAAPLKPFDHATEDASLVQYRRALVAAVETRDFGKLEKFLSPNVQLSFGGHSGLAEAKTMFKEQPDLWDKLARVLRNGGGFQTDRETRARMFVAPYTFFAKTPANLDAFEFVVLTGKDVPVYAKASTGSAVVKRLGYEVLAVDSKNKATEAWQPVKLKGGKSGWIEQKHLTSPVDHRAGFQKTGGAWKMIFFLAGD